MVTLEMAFFVKVMVAFLLYDGKLSRFSRARQNFSYFSRSSSTLHLLRWSTKSVCYQKSRETYVQCKWFAWADVFVDYTWRNPSKFHGISSEFRTPWRQ